jgi:riboflavin kinase/FMN adenylyltransferase
VPGAGRGRSLGFPTANLKPDRPLPLPAGVYACQALVDRARYRAVINVGVRPTFGETELTVEAYLLDFSGDLYGRRLELTFLRRLRDERKFANVEALRSQIALDVAAARQEA